MAVESVCGIYDSINIINPASDSTTTLSNAGRNLVQGTASDNAGGSGVKIVEVRTDTAAYRPATSKAPRDWSSWSIALSIATPGSSQIIARATDNAGNQAWNVITVHIVGTTPPPSATVDKFGIAKLQPTISGGREWVAKWDNGLARTLGNQKDPYY